MSPTLEQILFLERALVKRVVVAKCLDYSERHYYNIRRQLKKRLPVSRRLQETIRRKAIEHGFKPKKEAPQ